ncbi:hypothetical protein VU02_04555 [Desulfobulbus sp. N2]|nr:hypothetical protein [Desulfobulbus sp. N2]
MKKSMVLSETTAYEKENLIAILSKTGQDNIDPGPVDGEQELGHNPIPCISEGP